MISIPVTPHACIQCLLPLAVGIRVCPRCHALQPADAAQTVAPGVTIDRGYGRMVVDARVGSGGMGVVWRGWLFFAPNGPRANDAAEAIALKVMRPTAQVNPELRALFTFEGETLRRLAHPNIVRFYDLFEYTGSLVLAIEYVDGATLEEVIARNVARSRLAGAGSLPGLPFRRAWYYFEQLLGALAATHALGIVHRDVKPSNVLLRQDGIAKLTDFGIARNSSDPTLDPGGSAPGTSLYMSPEQVLSRPLDARSDLYSAATVLYEMLSGRAPFASDGSDFVIRQAQVERRPPPIRTYLTQAPPILDALFIRALSKDPAHRFASALEMGAAFREALGIGESKVWLAQHEFAAEAARFGATPVASHDDREKRLATLREFVVRGYQTAKMASR
jgi:serine/threonine protein kinase